MALSDKEKQKMGDAMLVAGTLRAGKELYEIAKPIVKKVVKGAKGAYKKLKKKKQTRKYDNNTYSEGK